jgi:hypothetical protein
VLIKDQAGLSGSDVLPVRFPVIADRAGINGNRVSLGGSAKADENHFFGAGMLHASDIKVLETGVHGLLMVVSPSGIYPLMMVVLPLMVSHVDLLYLVKSLIGRFVRKSCTQP